MSNINRRSFLKKSITGGLGIFTAPYFIPSRPEKKKPYPFSSSTAADSTQLAGYAERDITPEIGMEKPGGYSKAFHKAFHDPCKIRATVFGQNKNRVAIIGIDAGFIYRKSVLSVRDKIHQQCDIAPGAVMVAASHSHSSGPVGMVQPGQYDHASEFVQKLAYQESSCANPKYLREVEQAIVAGVCEADRNRQKTYLGIGIEVADQVAFNRRFHMKNGLTYTHPRPGNPHIEKVAGPTDPEVGVIGTWDTEGKLIGCVVNFACHATTNPGGISANYIYYLERTIRGVFGSDVTVVFVNGASGDVTQVDNLTPRQQYLSGQQAAQIVGGRIGAEAVKALLSMERGQLLPIRADNKVWNIQRRAPRPERVKESYDIVKAGPEQAGSTRWAFAKETLMLDALLEKSSTSEVEVQAIQIGPVVFLSVPAEYFCAHGLELKARSDLPYTFPVSLANGCTGYVPTEEAFGKQGGGYETRLTSYSHLEPTAGRQMLESLLELSSKMNPGDEPVRPPASEFSGPWSYGAVPPELGMWELYSQ